MVLPSVWMPVKIPSSSRSNTGERVNHPALAALETSIHLKFAATKIEAAYFVLNPRHPEASKVRIGQAEKFSFDPRMWK